MAGYLDELAQLRHTLDARYGRGESGPPAHAA
jgi:hypothetical protein